MRRRSLGIVLVGVALVTACSSAKHQSAPLPTTTTRASTTATTAVAAPPAARPTSTTTTRSAPTTIAPATTTTPTTTATTTRSTPPPSSSPIAVIGHWTGRTPVTIYFSGDAGNIATDLTWTSWNLSGAVAHGTWHYQNCIPNCASGSWTPYPVTIHLSNPVAGRFTKLVERTAGPKGFTRTFTAPDLGQGACTSQQTKTCA
jgi:hypothetical protein